MICFLTTCSADGIDGRELGPLGGMGVSYAPVADHIHHRELERCFTQFQLQGFSVTCFTWLYGFSDANFLVAWLNGGPVTLVYGWTVVVFGSALVTLSLAEVASACPNIGGE